MLKFIIGIAIVLVIGFVILLAYSLCAVSSRYDEQLENYYQSDEYRKELEDYNAKWGKNNSIIS